MNTLEIDRVEIIDEDGVYYFVNTFKPNEANRVAVTEIGKLEGKRTISTLSAIQMPIFFDHGWTLEEIHQGYKNAWKDQLGL